MSNLIKSVSTKRPMPDASLPAAKKARLMPPTADTTEVTAQDNSAAEALLLSVEVAAVEVAHEKKLLKWTKVATDDKSTLELLQHMMGTMSPQDALDKLFDHQVEMLKQGICLGIPMLPLKPYVSSSLQGLFQYVRDSMDQRKPLNCFAFNGYYKQQVLNGMNGANATILLGKANNSFVKHLHLSHFWYTLLCNVISKLEATHKKLDKVTYEQFMEVLKKYWNAPETEKKKFVKAWYGKDANAMAKLFYENDFEKSCKRVIDEYFFADYADSSVQTASKGSLIEIEEISID